MTLNGVSSLTMKSKKHSAGAARYRAGELSLVGLGRRNCSWDNWWRHPGSVSFGQCDDAEARRTRAVTPTNPGGASANVITQASVIGSRA